MANYIIGISGASGSVLAGKLVGFLLRKGEVVHLSFSREGLDIFNYELRLGLTPPNIQQKLRDHFGGSGIFFYKNDDFFAPIASGSFQSEAMVIVPCSMKSVSAIANGFSSGLIERAADVMIKEGRKLVIVPRETPLSSIHLENMLKLAKAGVVVLPPMPAFYNRPETVDDIFNYTVGKILDHIGVEHDLFTRWGEPEMNNPG